MNNPFSVLSNSAAGCNTCTTSVCSSCSPAEEKRLVGAAAIIASGSLNPKYKETSEAGLAALVLC